MDKFNLISKYFHTKKISIILIILFVAGIILITFSNHKPEPDTSEFTVCSGTENNGNLYECEESKKLAEELEEILSIANGVGETRVMIKYSTSSEKIPLTHKNSSTFKVFEDESGKSSKPFITKEISAEIEGVIIVAQGGDNARIKSEVSTAVSELLGIPIHKVNILKMNTGGK